MEKLLRILRSDVFFYCALLAAMVIKYFPFGFEYYTYLDDYNQYGVFNMISENKWNDIIVKYEWYAQRPLAGLLDAYVIAPLWDNLQFVLLAITLLHFASIMMLDKTFKRLSMTWGRVASIIFALYPLLAEASYWISASSRIVVGAFFAVLSVYLLTIYIHAKNPNSKKYILIGTIVTGLIAQGFYEQVVVFSFAFFILVFIMMRKDIKNKWVYSLPFINLALIGSYYVTFRNTGFLEDRSSMSLADIIPRAWSVLKNIKNVFTIEHGYVFSYLSEEGYVNIFKNYTLLFFVILIASGILGVSVYFSPQKSDKLGWSVFACIIMFSVSFAPFFLLTESYVYLRNIYISVIGIAIAVGIIWQLASKYKTSRLLTSIIAFCGAFIFMCSNIVEVQSYQTIEKHNIRISQNVLNTINGRDFYQAVVFNVKYTYEPVYAQHAVSSTLEDWSFNGVVEVVAQEIYYRKDDIYMQPIMAGRMFNKDLSGNRILIGLDNSGNSFEVTLKGEQLFKNDGTVYGYVQRDGERGGLVFRLAS